MKPCTRAGKTRKPGLQARSRSGVLQKYSVRNSCHKSRYNNVIYVMSYPGFDGKAEKPTIISVLEGSGILMVLPTSWAWAAVSLEVLSLSWLCPGTWKSTSSCQGNTHGHKHELQIFHSYVSCRGLWIVPSAQSKNLKYKKSETCFGLPKKIVGPLPPKPFLAISILCGVLGVPTVWNWWPDSWALELYHSAEAILRGKALVETWAHPSLEKKPRIIWHEVSGKFGCFQK